jgi:hypothetical protein
MQYLCISRAGIIGGDTATFMASHKTFGVSSRPSSCVWDYQGTRKEGYALSYLFFFGPSDVANT